MKKSSTFWSLCFLLLPLTVASQWTQTSPSLLNSSVSFGGAITYKAGKVWAGTTQLYVSFDSAATWSAVTTLNISGEVIVSIDFFDANNGLVVTYGGGAYQTSDGGSSWVRTLTRGSCLSGAFGLTKNVIVVAGRLNFAGHIYVSTDRGTNWSDNVIENGGGAYHVAVHKSGRICVLARNVSPTRNSYMYTSIDNGSTWIKGNVKIDLDSYGFTFGGCESDFIFLCNEAYNEDSDINAEVIRTDMAGNNAMLVHTNSHASLTGSGTHFGKAVFIQKAISGGLLRSTDDGVNWISIGGPYALWDSRCIYAINENLLVAVDINGSIWRTFNGGGSPIEADTPRFIYTPPNTLNISVCDVTDILRATFRIATTCSIQKLYITSETFSGANPELFTLISLAPPYVVDGNVNATIAVRFTSNEPGVYSSILDVIGYYEDAGGRRIPFDTTIEFSAKVAPAPPNLKADPATIAFPSLSPCDNDVDTSITLKNTGCDTLKILSGPGFAPPGFRFDSIQFPIFLPPGASVSFNSYFAPSDSGAYLMNAVFECESNGLQQSLLVVLTGVLKGADPELSIKDSVLSFRSMTVCDPAIDTTVTLTNIGCDTLHIISGPGLLAAGFTIDSLDFPIVLAPGESIPLNVHFDAPDVGTFSSTATYVADSKGTLSDLEIDLLGIGKAVAPQLHANLAVHDFGLVSTCDKQKDTSVVLTNTGCDTLIITSGPGALPPEFTMNGMTLPIILPPDSSVTLYFSFYPSGNGLFTTTPLFICERKGLKGSVTFRLTGSGTEGTGVLSTDPVAFQFRPLAICLSDSLEGFIENTGCDTLIIDEVILAGDPDFQSSTIQSLFALAPKAKLPYSIYLLPQTKGPHTSTMTIRAHTAHGSQTTSTQIITIQGIVNDGSRTLSAAPDNLNFGTTTVCDTPDSLITLENLGCDTLTITAADISGSGFFLDTSFPIVIPKGERRIVRIVTLIDTIDGVRSNTDTVTFISNAENMLAPIVLRRDYKYPKRYIIELVESAVGSAGDIVRFDLRTNEQLENITSLDLDFTFNTDLLELVGVEGDNSITFTNGHVHITGSPIVSDTGVIGSLLFLVYLTKDSTSDLTLSNLHLNGGSKYFEDCIASANATGSDFTYRYDCGERTLVKYMSGVQIFSITSLRPNPASGEFELKLESRQQGDIIVTIYDALGKKMHTQVKPIGVGIEKISVDAGSWESGIYYLEAKAGKTRETISFVKTR